MEKRMDKEKNNCVDKKEVSQEEYTIEELLRLGKETNEMELAKNNQAYDEQ